MPLDQDALGAGFCLVYFGALIDIIAKARRGYQLSGKLGDARKTVNHMDKSEMQTTARAMVAPGKGILAADESLPTIEKRFKTIGVASTEENRRTYRELLFATPGLGNCISGVILFDETLRQKGADGTPFVEILGRQGIIPGIKVDNGAKPLAGFPGDKITEGLDGLRERFAEYAKLGARFSKWRAVIGIGQTAPGTTCLESNAEALGRFAALSQEAGLVPIVEPEVLMDGDHTMERHLEVTDAALGHVFNALRRHQVQFEAMVLKPNMVLPGKSSPRQASNEEIADATVTCLLRNVPPAVPGIVFLSGGQSEVQATERLNAINQRASAPWALSFSYGRALQDSTMAAWRGRPENRSVAQAALLHRARCNSAARSGNYNPEMERSPGA
jgi:fructose-bisphosphate aldolase class I